MRSEPEEDEEGMDLASLLGEKLPTLPDLQHAVASSAEEQAAEFE